MKLLLSSVLGLAALFQGSLAHAGETLSGRPLVLEGDTLFVRGKVVGLYGIAAPGLKQTCWNAKGISVECGKIAAQALEKHIGEANVVCQPKGLDRHRRQVAVCKMGEEDLAAFLVSRGLAVADRAASSDYVAHDTKAWAKRRGLWAGVFENPADRPREDISLNVKLTDLVR